MAYKLLRKLKQSRSFDKGDSFGAVFDISSPLMRLLDKASFEQGNHFARLH